MSLSPPANAGSSALRFTAGLLVLVGVACGGGETSQHGPDLDHFIQERMDRARAPGLAAAVVQHDRIVWSAEYGLADREEQVPVSESTLFEVGSISKTVLATAVMQQVEQGRIRLDDPVAPDLPFRFQHPGFPEVPLTYRMLLTHTSSAMDNWPVVEAAFTQGRDSPVALDTWLQSYFDPAGTLFSAQLNFGSEAPGTAWHYTNEGAAVLALAVERLSGLPFDRYCKDHIFQPLGMRRSSYRLADVEPEALATPYTYDGAHYLPAGQLGHPEYPVVTLRTTAKELAVHLMSFIDYGEHAGAIVLQPSTVAEMRRRQVPDLDPDQAIIWRYGLPQAPELLGHLGADVGTSALMYFRPSDGMGVVVLTNGDALESLDPEEGQALVDIAMRLLASFTPRPKSSP